LVGILAVAACGSGAAAPAAPSASTSASLRATAAAGKCTNGPSQTLHLTAGGFQRTAIVHVPAKAPASPRPLVLNLHGSQSDAKAQVALTGMNASADDHGFIVVYPQAAIAAASGFDWNIPGVPLIGGRTPPPNAANDVDFLTRLVTTMESRFCIDAKRVYVTGFSGGARMASQLACDASTTFAAIAPVSGLRMPSPCPATRLVPVIAFHGTADPVDPYAGHGQAYWTYSVMQAASDWGRFEGCDPTPTSRAGSGFTLATYAGCRQQSQIQLYSITGEGHEWPAGPHLRKAITKTLGPQSAAVNANSVMWDFFAAHPMA
jgi:polyhydroxybutyrate depolymerase